MIVNIAAWLYIINAALGLWALTARPFGSAMETIATLLISALMAALGVGLLKRLAWARWLALGSSLLGWTLGSLILLACIAFFFTMREIFGAWFSGGLGTIIGFVVMFFVAIFVVSIVINFKLYFHLRSEKGAEEFGVELEPFGTVMGSTGAWLAIFAAQWFVAGSGFDFRNSSGVEYQGYEQTTQETDQQELGIREQQRVLAEQRAAQEAREVQEAQEIAKLEMERREAENAARLAAAEVAPAPAYQDSMPVKDERQESEPTSRNQILKCRDASGAMQYTQGYCPPGTRRVE